MKPYPAISPQLSDNPPSGFTAITAGLLGLPRRRIASVATLVVQTPALITLMLAAVPATKRWLDYPPAIR